MKHATLTLLFVAVAVQAAVVTVVSPTQTVDQSCVDASANAASAAGATLVSNCPVIQSVTSTFTAPAPVPPPPAPPPAPVPPPPPPAPAPPPVSSDFAARCAAPGVVKCVGFDSPADIAGGDNDNSGINRDGTSIPTLDSTVKTSGASSLKFTVPAVSDANSSGAYFANFSPDLSVQFGAGQDFYIQWRQRFSPEMLQHFPVDSGQGGFKQFIVGSGDQPGKPPIYSCSKLEVVVADYAQMHFPGMYNSCTGSGTGANAQAAYSGLYEKFTNAARDTDFKLQNGRPSPGCLYSQGNTNPETFFKPGTCIGYVANEWMTFQVHIKVGVRSGDQFVGSLVELWIAREGQPSQLAISIPFRLAAGPASLNERFGKVWLLPYNTGKSGSATNPVAYTWYDDLIISRQKIADPQ